MPSATSLSSSLARTVKWFLVSAQVYQVEKMYRRVQGRIGAGVNLTRLYAE